MSSPWLFKNIRSYFTQASDSSMIVTPTTEASQLTWPTEVQMRFSTCRFIEDLASIAEIPLAPVVTAQIYVHRFYMLHSFSRHDRFLVATAALFLAAKSEEFPIKCRTLTECSLYILLCPNHAFSKSPATSSPVSPSSLPGVLHRKRRRAPPAKGAPSTDKQRKSDKRTSAKHKEYLQELHSQVSVGDIEQTSHKVLLTERIVLLSLGFEVSAPEPFTSVSTYMDAIWKLEAVHPSVRYESARDLAHVLLGDAVKYGMTLAFPCEILAAGAVYLGCLYRRQIVPDVTTEESKPWWTLLHLSETELLEVSKALLWMYEENGRPKDNVHAELKDLWDRVDPKVNLPDLERVRQLDAEVASG